jgi:hypothetical protein
MSCVVRFITRRFILISDYLNVWRRAPSRMTFRFKFNLDDVCRRALLRATPDVIFIIIQVPHGALRRTTSRFILNSV